MDTKKERCYRITIENVDSNERLQFDHQDREDLFEIIRKIEAKQMVAAELAPKLGLGLRLMGPMIMMNRKLSVFADFFPHFKAFYIKLKNTVKSSTDV